MRNMTAQWFDNETRRGYDEYCDDSNECNYRIFGDDSNQRTDNEDNE